MIHHACNPNTTEAEEITESLRTLSYIVSFRDTTLDFVSKDQIK